ncbi:MAG: transposase, partial [Desulfosalsimonas sp.]
PELWPWNSAAAHISGKNDKLVTAGPVLSLINGSWHDFLAKGLLPEESENIRLHERTGRPLGSTSFVSRLEQMLGKNLNPQKRGRKPRQNKK